MLQDSSSKRLLKRGQLWLKLPRALLVLQLYCLFLRGGHSQLSLLIKPRLGAQLQQQLLRLRASDSAAATALAAGEGTGSKARLLKCQVAAGARHELSCISGIFPGSRASDAAATSVRQHTCRSSLTPSTLSCKAGHSAQYPRAVRFSATSSECLARAEKSSAIKGANAESAFGACKIAPYPSCAHMQDLTLCASSTKPQSSLQGAVLALLQWILLLKARWARMLGRILWLFFPIFIGQLAATSMGVVDTVMAGSAGTLQLSGVAIGSSIFWPSELFVVGLALFVHPVVSNLVGAGRFELIAERMQVASIVCLCFSLLVGLFMALIPFAYYLLPDINEDMIRIGHGYLLSVALAMPAYAMFNVLRAYWEGMGKTLPTLCFGCMALMLNIPLNYIFIFGHLGMPALGGMGCGVATAITMYFTVGVMLLFVQKHPMFVKARLFRRFYRVPVRSYLAFAKGALPLGIAGMVETLCFSLVSLLLSPFGPAVVSAHTIAMNVSGLLVIVPLALSSVASIEVGEALGRRDWALLQKRVQAAVFLAALFYVVALLTLIFGRNAIAAFYSSDLEVLELAPVLMLYCAVFLLPDTMQLMASGIVRGFKDTKSIFIITLVAYWLIGMPIGLGCGYFTATFYGATGFWLGFICSLSCACVLLWYRVHQLTAHHSRFLSLPA